VEVHCAHDNSHQKECIDSRFSKAEQKKGPQMSHMTRFQCVRDSVTKIFLKILKSFSTQNCKLYYTLLFTKITNILLTDNMHKRTKLSNRNRRIIRHINRPTIVHIQVQIIRVHTDSHRHSSHIPMLNRRLIHSLIQLPTLG